MMGSSQASKARSHDRIVRTASVRFRERGLERIGLAELLADAGLTHGAFYRHFDSRDELVSEGIEEALRAGGEAMEAVAAASDDSLRAVVAAYLNPAHRDELGTSCAVATLASDVARSTDRARSAYAAQVERYIELLIRLGTPGAERTTRARAITILATLVGAITMARAVDDQALSDELLEAARMELLDR
jgi:TetR/AcrR family transcriptional regulator, transcriptional repressor for nem operon